MKKRRRRDGLLGRRLVGGGGDKNVVWEQIKVLKSGPDRRRGGVGAADFVCVVSNTAEYGTTGRRQSKTQKKRPTRMCKVNLQHSSSP